jgi:hypothetical protein
VSCQNNQKCTFGYFGEAVVDALIKVFISSNFHISFLLRKTWLINDFREIQL